MIGCSRPSTTASAFIAPATTPQPSTQATASARCSAEPDSSVEARQLASTTIAPTERSMPPVSTTKVCAMAISASSTPLFAAVTSTSTETPRGCSDR